MTATSHYDASYFEYQSRHGETAAMINRVFFEALVRGRKRTLDFGCGGGFLLQVLRVEEPIGVEVNPVAAAHARSLGIHVVSDLNEIADRTIDAIISSHALEHVENPSEQARQMHRVLKEGGVAVVLVPCDRPWMKFSPSDNDKHLFSWSANNIGNLFANVGFKIIEAREIKSRFPPYWYRIYDWFGLGSVRLVAKIYGRMSTVRAQVRLVAVR
jgi:SAM-dependent methyltransferase